MLIPFERLVNFTIDYKQRTHSTLIDNASIAEGKNGQLHFSSAVFDGHESHLFLGKGGVRRKR
jgi:hypothetical protein